ncbi:vascular endothelial growth factor receptor 1-like [Clytia hemisphaerica]
MRRVLVVLMITPAIFQNIVLGDFQFVSKSWLTVPAIPHIIHKAGKDFTIECMTNEPKAVVTLEVRLENQNILQNARTAFPGRLVEKDQNFVIQSISDQDNGVYFCRATNNSQKISLNKGILDVRKPQNSDIDLYPDTTELLIERGGDANITCEAHDPQGLPLSYLTWLKQSQDGSPVAVDSSRVSSEGISNLDIEVLMFKNFELVRDGGVYICQRQYPKGDVSSKTITVNQKADVPLQINLLGKTRVIEGSRLILTCQTSGVPAPSVTQWFKDGKKQKSCDKEECVLTVQSTQHPKDDGQYSCHTKNRYQQILKKINITILAPPLLEKFQKVHIADFDEEYQVTCSLTKNTNPPPSITLQSQPNTCIKDETNCQPISSAWKLIEREVTQTTKLSFIAPATKSSIFYRCIAKNEVGNSSTTMLLTRKNKKDIQFGFLNENPHMVNEESPLNITCISDPYIYKNVSITAPSHLAFALFTPYVKTYTEDKQRITTYYVKKAKLSMNGVFTCIGALVRTGELRKIHLNVTVKELKAPSVGFVEKDLTISQDQNKNYLLDCQVSGNPQPDVIWKFSGSPITVKDDISSVEKCETHKKGFYSISGENDQLVICQLDYKKHEGVYECVASNKVGTPARAIVNLQITAKPEITSILGDVTFRFDLDDQITCKAHGNPHPKVTWYRINQSNNRNSTELTTHNRLATLNSTILQRYGSGVYKCLAKNSEGETSKGMNLTLITADKNTQSADNLKEIFIGIALAFVLMIIFMICFILWYKRRLKKKHAAYLKPNSNFVLDPDRSLFDQSNELPYDMTWEFPQQKLTFIKSLGKGAFGEVWLAEAEGITEIDARDKSNEATKRRKRFRNEGGCLARLIGKNRKTNEGYQKTLVAVKTLKDESDASQYKDLASELKILIHVGQHKNIVNLLGACTLEGKLRVILEFCFHGNLLTFLRSKRDSYQDVWEKHKEDMSDEFTNVDMLKIALDIAQGMEFLESRKCVHRDLAARNVLVSVDFTMKIGDFGLARDLINDEFYLKQTSGLVPIKWMPPEAIKDKIYNSLTDVWSYGIVLWEIYSLGGSPYPGLPAENLMKFLDSERRMECPDHCPISVYKVMLKCWSKVPFNRPSFKEIKEELSSIMQENSPNYASQYIDLTPNDFEDGNVRQSRLYLEATDGDQEQYSDQHSNEDEHSYKRPLLDSGALNGSAPNNRRSNGFQPAHIPLLDSSNGVDYLNGDTPYDDNLRETHL